MRGLDGNPLTRLGDPTAFHILLFIWIGATIFLLMVFSVSVNALIQYFRHG